MYGFDLSQFDQTIRQLEQMGTDINQIAERVLDAGSEPARQAFINNIPYDENAPDNHTHARDNVVVSKTKTAKKTKNRYRVVESKTDKIDPKTGKKVPYLYFVENGHVRAPAKPFIQKAYGEAQAAAAEPMKIAFNHEFEEHMR